MEQPGGTSYQHYTPYPLSQAQEVLKETRLSTNGNKSVSLLLHISEAKLKEDKAAQFNKDHLWPQQTQIPTSLVPEEREVTL